MSLWEVEPLLSPLLPLLLPLDPLLPLPPLLLLLLAPLLLLPLFPLLLELPLPLLLLLPLDELAVAAGCLELVFVTVVSGDGASECEVVECVVVVCLDEDVVEGSAECVDEALEDGGAVVLTTKAVNEVLLLVCEVEFE